MSLSLALNPFTTLSRKPHLKITLTKPKQCPIYSPPKLKTTITTRIRATSGDYSEQQVNSAKPKWEEFLSKAASLYPVYVSVGGIVGCLKPETFAWFVKGGHISYSFTLAFIMLVMGLTLELKDLLVLFLQRPLAVSPKIFFFLSICVDLIVIIVLGDLVVIIASSLCSLLQIEKWVFFFPLCDDGFCAGKRFRFEHKCGKFIDYILQLSCAIYASWNDLLYASSNPGLF